MSRLTAIDLLCDRGQPQPLSRSRKAETPGSLSGDEADGSSDYWSVPRGLSLTDQAPWS